jgi:hypothetical protein
MTLVEATDADRETAMTRCRSASSPIGHRAPASEWVTRWNETVGEVVDIEIATN